MYLCTILPLMPLLLYAVFVPTPWIWKSLPRFAPFQPKTVRFISPPKRIGQETWMSSPLLRAVKLPIMHTLSRGWLDWTGSSDLGIIFWRQNQKTYFNISILQFFITWALSLQLSNPSALPLNYNRHKYEKVKLGRKLSCNKVLSGSLAICYAS